MMLVTGAKGAAGSYAEEVFGGEKLHLTDIDDLDLTDAAAVRSTLLRLRPKTVIHLAAETNVDRCQNEPEHAYRANTYATENLAKACREAGALMVYISTGGVFDGEKSDPYTEEDTPSPSNLYSKTKYEGERAVASILERYFIVRAGWMIGGGRRDKKFIYKVLLRMSTEARIQAVSDKWGTLTYAKEMLEQIGELLKTEAYGVYHCANAGRVTRFDVAQELARLIGSPIEVVAVDSSAFPLPAPRAKSEALRNYRLEKLGINRMSGWKDALAEYVRELERVGVLKDGKIVAPPAPSRG